MNIYALLESEFQIHPQAQAIDYYKLLYQSVFGAGHFIANEEKAWQFFQKEWDENVDSQPVKIQDISLIQPMYRIYFGRDATLRKEDIFSAFILSAKQQIEFAWSDWQHLWLKAERLLQRNIPLFKEDSDIENRFLTTNQIPSHSEIYKAAYNPHYRIINETGYETLFPKIKGLL